MVFVLDENDGDEATGCELADCVFDHAAEDTEKGSLVRFE